MPRDNLATLRQLLREAVRSQGRSHRQLEERLGIGHGNIEKLLSGRAEIKVRHLLVLAELLDVPPADFLALGCPEATAAARRRLADVIAPRLAVDGSATASPAAPTMTAEQLAELVREAVRTELARQQQPRGPARS